MLASIVAVLIPTIAIGCLPTYTQAGRAAPALLAVCRFLQGIAVGGEWGACVVYLYETAPKGKTGLNSSLAQVAIYPGMLLGIAVVQAVLSSMPQGEWT